MKFICPKCRGPLERPVDDAFECLRDRVRFERKAGVWSFLTPDRAEHFSEFMHEYEIIRRHEGRASGDSNYYRCLPDVEPGRRLANMWQQRAASYYLFTRVILAPLAGCKGRLAALDLGAGNGWLSNRLAEAGNQAWAVDLLTNDWDGLGAHRHYENRFYPIQAEFEALPFEHGQFDLLVFNASFHYSASFERTLDACLPLLKDDGSLVIMDTPVYKQLESGRRMVAERGVEFTARFGFPSNALPMENFLTHSRLEALVASQGLELQTYMPDFGWQRRLRSRWFRFRSGREAAEFPVIHLRRPHAGAELPR